MRNTKALLCLLLIALLLGTLSCTDSSDKPDTTTYSSGEDTTSAETEDTLYADLPTGNFDGAEFSMLSEDQTTWAIVQMTADEQNGEILNDTIYMIDRLVEDRLNVKITSAFLSTSADVNDVIRSSFAAGDDEYSVYNSPSNVTAPLILEAISVSSASSDLTSTSRGGTRISARV